MKKFFVLVVGLMFCLPLTVNAYEVNVGWQRNYGGSAFDIFSSVSEVKDGGYIAVGYTVSTDIEGITHNGLTDALIVKYNTRGDIEWQKNYGGSFVDSFSSVIETKDGGYVAVGDSNSKDIDGITHKNLSDGIIVKFNKDGDVVWQTNYGGDKPDYLEDVTETIDGGIVIVGSIRSTNIDGIIALGADDGVVAKFDKDGNLVWQKNYGGSDNDYYESVKATNDGGVIVVGRLGSEDAEGITSKGDTDAIIIKYDKNGNIEWQTNYGGDFLDYFFDVEPLEDGNYIAVGSSMSSNIVGDEYFDNEDAIIVKYDKSGNVLWEKNFGGISHDYFVSVSKTKDGSFIAVGATNIVDAEDPSDMGQIDAIIIKYDKDGNIEWQKQLGGSGDDSFEDIAVTKNDFVVVGYSDSTDLELMHNYGKNDAMIIKYVNKYEISINGTGNGKATVEQYDDGNGRINAVPNEGYVLDEIIIKDTTGKEVVYEEKDGYYYFDINDDLVITVTFKKLPNEVVKDTEEDKEEENPKTADAFVYYACSVVCSLFGIWSVEQYRKTRRVS